MTISPYRLYEASVQSPKWMVDYLFQFVKILTGNTPKTFREDFCGTAAIACEWARQSTKHFSVGIDIDKDLLKYAKDTNINGLPKAVRKRVMVQNQTVLMPTAKKFDFIGAFNYSFFIFHTRSEFKKYLMSSYRSLVQNGALFLETAGGNGFLSTHSETSKCQIPGYGTIFFTWEHHQYDPITQVNNYSLHFKLKDNKILADAFTYHWRIWGIREIRELLVEVGFKNTHVLWQKRDKKQRPINEFYITENAPPEDQWVAYVVGVK